MAPVTLNSLDQLMGTGWELATLAAHP